MKKHSIYSLVLFSLLLNSCEKDWLNKKNDQSLTVPGTLKDFQALLDNTEVTNTSDPSLGEIASDGHYITDQNFTNRSEPEKNAYTWSRQYPYLVVLDWINVYKRVLNSNIILEGLEKVTESSTNDIVVKNNLKGQALFVRAKSFFDLAQIFAPVYKELTADTDLGIPLKLSSDIQAASKRFTNREVYSIIISDLLMAKSLLPLNGEFKTRASKVATYALLARVYLSMSDYQNALFNADSCLHLYNNLINYDSLFNIVGSPSVPFPLFNTEVIYHSSMTNFVTIGSQARIEADFKSSYDQSDRRSNLYFGTSAGLTTFKGSYAGSSVLRFTGLATDEMYLIRAECNARLGNTDLAMDDLNTLLQNRWQAPFTPLTATDATEALIKILNERKKELVMRGLRWMDIRRLNLEPAFAAPITRTVSGQTFILEPNSYNSTFPIPDDVIAQSGIEQNSGW